MPLPILAIPGIAAAAYGLYKSGKAAKDKIEANKINDDAGQLIKLAIEMIEEQKQRTSDILEDYGSRKLRAFTGSIEEFIHTFGQLKNVELLDSPELDKFEIGNDPKNILENLENNYNMLVSSGLGVGVGLGGGAAIAFGAYNGTMLLATSGTGAAISTLSGAAATNATLAWLGGGTLAAGGAGMAGGLMVLGGLVAGPALAVFGLVVGNKAEKALSDAKSNNQIARTNYDEAILTCEKLKAVDEIVNLANKIFSTATSNLRRSTKELKKVIDISGNNFEKFNDKEKKIVFKSVKFAQLVKAMIDTPILDENGNLVLSTEKKIKELQSQI